jgi:hypothetical protein
MDYYLTPPDGKKYSLYEALRFLACRGQGASWENGNPTGNGSAIGNDATQEAHVFELRPQIRPELSTIEWIAMGPAEFSIYLPYYGSLITDVYYKYNYQDQRSYNAADPYDNTYWHVFRQLHTLCKGPGTSNAANRLKYGGGVQAFWERCQLSLIEQQATVDAALERIYTKKGRPFTEKIATDISIALAEQTYGYAVDIVEELKAFNAAGAQGDFVPSFLDDPEALPRYAEYVKILDEAIPTARVEKITGNKNRLFIKVSENYFDGTINVIEENILIDNNSAGNYQVGGYIVYVNTKGNDQIRECYIID